MVIDESVIASLLAPFGGIDALTAEPSCGTLDRDSAVYRLDDDRAIILTAAVLTPVVADEHDWGRVAAAHALSDVYARGGVPLAAVNLAAWQGDDPMALLAEAHNGGSIIAKEAGCVVAGGHTIDDPIAKYGLAAVGMAHPGGLFQLDQLAVGDTLVLTKALGTGVIKAAIEGGAADEAWVRAAVTSMSRLNSDAREVAASAGVLAATGVCRLGLLGHLHRMARASDVAVHVDARAVPLLPGAREAVAAGHVPECARTNAAQLAPAVALAANVADDVAVLLHDAQTSGGLVFAVPSGVDAGAVVAALRGRDLTAAVVGRVVDGAPGSVTITG